MSLSQFTTFLLASSLLLTTNCSPSKEISHWRNLPHHQAIAIVTISGSEFTFSNWATTADSTFIGLTDSSAKLIPGDSIRVAYVIDETGTTIINTSLIAGGVLLGVVVLWYVIDLFADGIGIGKIG